jgi:hypothetical protein
MTRNIFASSALFFFVIISACATIENFSSHYAGASRPSFATGDGGDALPAAAPAIRFNRFTRAKILAKAWVTSHWSTPRMDLTWLRGEIPFPRPPSKYPLYQQQNVYRL